MCSQKAEASALCGDFYEQPFAHGTRAQKSCPEKEINNTRRKRGLKGRTDGRLGSAQCQADKWKLNGDYFT
jgi:hypothetical protein